MTSSGSVRIFYPAQSREEIIRAVREGVLDLAARAPLLEAVLFGSVASGRQTVSSDVDLLIVYRGPVRDDVFALAKRLIRVSRLEPHIYSASQADHARQVLDRMTRDGVRVYPVQ